MRCLNKVQLIGFLGNKPVEKKYNENIYTNFSIAINTEFKQNGEKAEKTDWFSVFAFGKLAEICINYLDKGDKVYIEGTLQKKEYEDNGVKHNSVFIRLNNLIMLTVKKNNTNTVEEPEEEIPF